MPTTAMPQTQVYADPDSASRALAADVASLINSRHALGQSTVLGLATGSTPIPFYRELVRLHRKENLSFQNVITFNLDEYQGLPPNHPQSYHRFMQEHLFNHVDIPATNTHLPDGTTPVHLIDQHCAAYEEAIIKAGGIDLQVLGIGHTGHIGFNEPGTSRQSRTGLVNLTAETRSRNARFFDQPKDVPTAALSMGCATILEAKQIALMAWGESKAAIIKRALHGPVSEDCPASYLQEHPNTSVFLDEPAAAQLG